MKRNSLQERLKRRSRICKQTGCWIWFGAKKGNSKLTRYGNIMVGSRTNGTHKTTSTHRASYQAFIGEIPKNKWVLHKCDNPSCINPDHLFLGDRQSNVNDRQNKGRNQPIDGEKNPNCKHTSEEIKEIRKLRKQGMTLRKIAEKFGYSGHKTVFEITHNRKWKIPEPPK